MPRPGRQRRGPSYGGIQRSIKRQAQHLLETGRRFESFDQIRQRHFWSAAIFIADNNGYIEGARQLFVTPAGQNGQGFPSGVALDARDTNWKSSNRVPDNQNFEITELGVTLGVLPAFPALGIGDDELMLLTGRDANSFLTNTVLAITYLTNSVPLGMASDFAQASGPAVGTFISLEGGTGTANNRFQTNGFAAPALRRRFKIPILLQHGETFSFELSLPRAVHLEEAEVLYARMDFWATESFAEKS